MKMGSAGMGIPAPVSRTFFQTKQPLAAVLRDRALARPRHRSQFPFPYLPHELMNIQANHWRMARRTFLRGLGATVALPWLEAMSANAKSITTAGSMAASEIPRRAMFTYWGLG